MVSIQHLTYLMISRSNFIIAVLSVAVVALAGYVVVQNGAFNEKIDRVYYQPDWKPGTTVPTTTTPTPSTPAPTMPTSTPATPTSTTNPLIQVTFPQANDLVSSPLTITGQARGNWYFEASFPIKLYDANNVLLGTGIAQAQGNWMTTNFVPFIAVLTYSTPTTTTGTLVLEKDNPSGEPANDASIQIPVTF